MNLFDKLTNEALKNQPDLSSLRAVVEKELLHHDILKILSQNNFLKDLTFVGGTALRSCYGGVRLSEDLDFTGGTAFKREQLLEMGDILVNRLMAKYGLEVEVTSPYKDKSNVDTWKIKITTQPEQKDLPKQHINIDICAIPSYEKRPMMLMNPYGVNMGTSGLIIQTQSKEEIYTDKLIAFALRPNRVKYRDVWDIIWLNQNAVKQNFSIVDNKLEDRKIEKVFFIAEFKKRCELLLQDKEILFKEFKSEMRRFLPLNVYSSIDQDNYWDFVIYLMQSFQEKF